LAGLPNETWWVLGGMYLGVKTPIPTLPLCCVLCCNQSPGAAGSYIMLTCILQILAPILPTILCLKPHSQILQKWPHFIRCCISNSEGFRVHFSQLTGDQLVCNCILKVLEGGTKVKLGDEFLFVSGLSRVSET